MEYYSTYEELSIDLLHSGKGHDDNPPGRGSGRHGWGTGNRPYQRTPKSLRDKLINKTSKTFVKSNGRIKKKEAKNNNLSSYEKYYENVISKMTPDELNNFKKQAINKASAQELLFLRNKDILSPNDINEAMRRIDWDKRLISYVNDEKGPTLSDRIDKVADMTKKINNWTRTGLDVYDTVKRIDQIAKNIDNKKANNKKNDNKQDNNKQNDNKQNRSNNKKGR